MAQAAVHTGVSRRAAAAAYTKAEPARAHRLQALTGLRAVAALLVVMFHFLTIHVAKGAGLWPLVTRTGANVVASGYTGVSFFFILSGFILAYTYTDPRGRLRGTARGFWWARFARIYPVYALAVGVGYLLYLKWHVWHEQFCTGPRPSWTVTGEHPVLTGVASLSLTQDWLPCTMTWNAPAWSLSAEAFFYLLFPLAALGLARLRRPYLLGVVALCWAAIAATALAYILFSLDSSAMRSPWWHRYWAWGLYSNPVVRLPEFLLGVALGRLFITRDTAGRDEGGQRRRRFLSPSPRALSALALAGIVAVWCVGPLQPMLLNHMLIDPLYALLIYTVAFGEGPVAFLFALPAAVLLGEASYGLYILHWPLMGLVSHTLKRPRLSIPGYVASSTVYFLIYLCIVVAVSIASFRLVEQPARRLIVHGVHRRRTT